MPVLTHEDIKIGQVYGNNRWGTQEENIVILDITKPKNKSYKIKYFSMQSKKIDLASVREIYINYSLLNSAWSNFHLSNLRKHFTDWEKKVYPELKKFFSKFDLKNMKEKSNK